MIGNIFKLLTLLIPSAIGLKCFTCTKHSGSKEIVCPSSTSSYTIWASATEKYYDVGSPSNFSCAVRVGGNGVVYHQGGIPNSSCNNSDTMAHITALVNKDSGTSGARFVCCNTDGCNWSLDTALGNISPFAEVESESVLVSALPFIISIILFIALIGLCCALCCGTSFCAACGCLCCGEARKGKKKKNVARDYNDTEPAININNRFKSLERPEVEIERTLTPVGGEENEGDQLQDDTATTDTTREVSANKINVQAAESEEEEEEEEMAIETSDKDGVKNPKSVDEDAITKTAKYYFQPKYS